MSSATGVKGIRCLLDTNILLRDADETCAQHAIARSSLLSLTTNGAQLFITAQNLIEFWAVAARPTSANGLGLSAQAIEKHLTAYETAFEFLPDVAAIFSEWRRLANTYAPQGKPTHDTRLVAVMKVYGLTHILTFNVSDFQRYTADENITVVEPTG